MGQRSRTETVVAVIVRLLVERTASQASLAREVGVESRTAARVLRELQDAGVPLERSEDPPHVYWSVPKAWVPGGLLLTGPQGQQLLAQLALSPRTDARDRLMGTIAALVAGTPRLLEVIEGPNLSEQQFARLGTLQRCAAERRPVRMRYFSAHRGHLDTRVVSVQYIEAGQHPRFAAYCHSHHTLRWFRLDGVETAEEDTSSEFVRPVEETLAAFLRGSASGFHAGTLPIEIAFFVRSPDWRWVERNLPVALPGSDERDGRVYRGRTSALPVLARFVASLGDAARPLTPELAEAVSTIAHGALRNASLPPDQD